VRGSTPVPPEDTRINYVHYESFCGWEPRPNDKPVKNRLPRAFSSEADHIMNAIEKLKVQLKIDRDALDAWVKKH